MQEVVAVAVETPGQLIHHLVDKAGVELGATEPMVQQHQELAIPVVAAEVLGILNPVIPTGMVLPEVVALLYYVIVQIIILTLVQDYQLILV